VQFARAVRAGDRLRVRTEVLSTRLTSRGDRGLVVCRCEIIDADDAVRIVIDVTSLYRARPADAA